MIRFLYRAEMKETSSEELKNCLKPTWFIDHDSPVIIAFAKRVIGDCAGNDIDKGIRLFYAVRDEIRYDPYGIELNREGFKASAILTRRRGYCVAKAIVLAALARVVSIPSRIGFADVRNHLTTERLKSLMKTDVFHYHGFTELFIRGRWVKATPTFNMSLCNRFGVKPLDFDGCHDALFHEFDAKGNRHMEYIKYHGSFADFPYEVVINFLKNDYPELFDDNGHLINGDFEKEAAEDRNSAT